MKVIFWGHTPEDVDLVVGAVELLNGKPIYSGIAERLVCDYGDIRPPIPDPDRPSLSWTWDKTRVLTPANGEEWLRATPYAFDSAYLTADLVEDEGTEA